MRKWVLVLGLAAIVGALGGAVSIGDAQVVYVPKNATVVDAKLQLTAIPLTSSTITVHRIKKTWVESTVTWANFIASDPNAAYDPAVLATSIVVAGVNTIESAGLKALVQAWVNGTVLNYGLVLRNVPQIGEARFYSSEIAASAPSLTIKYHTGNPLDPTTVVIRRGVAGEVQDSHIRKFTANTNYGASSPLWVKWVATTDPAGERKMSLLWFKFGVKGCTHTFGYWKTHSLEGPAPYDPTWKLLSNRQEDTPFFTSGKTYYEALWAAPKGNAYWILARQYIAAELSNLSGASLSAVATEFGEAAKLLQTYGPTYNFKKNKLVRLQFVMIADTLDQYNNGLIGPGHCPD